MLQFELHNMFSGFFQFRNDSGAVFSSQFTGPSANSRSRVNPAFRLYHFDDSKLELFDYDQYYLDLQKKGDQKNLIFY